MRYKPIIIVALGLVGYFEGQLYAQSLSALEDTLLARNPEIQYYDRLYDAALMQASQVNTLPDPEFGAGWFALPVETRLGAQAVRLSGTQMMPWFGTLEAREDLALASAEVKAEPARIAALDLVFQLKTAYYDLYKLDEEISITASRLGILNSLRPALVGKVESGEGSSADVLRLDVKIREWEQAIEIYRSQERKSIAVINRLLNRSPEASVMVDDTLEFAMLPYDVDTLGSYVGSAHPVIRMLSQQQFESERRIDLNNKMRKPSAGLGLDYIFVSPRDDASPDHNGRDILQLKAVMTIPIYGRKYDAKQQEEEINIEALEQRKRSAELAFNTAIIEAMSDYETARLQYELYDSQVEKVRSARRMLLSEYTASGSKFDELLAIELELLDYDRKVLDAIVRSHKAVAALEKLADFNN